jgi:signal transduction histidine kinase
MTKIKLSEANRRPDYANMKQRLTTFSQRYVAALRAHLRPGNGADSQPALALGRQAVALGLETLGLARLHEQSLGGLLPAKPVRTRAAATRRAEIFFNAANTLIEETHHAARQGKIQLNRANASLTERTSELAASSRELQRSISRRKVMEAAFTKTSAHHGKSLEESLQLQHRLRQLTRQVLAAQENERQTISRELQNEIAQTLLGINVRLLSLKQEARINHKGLKQEIASTQEIVGRSAKSVRRVARELRNS